jgi:NADPH-dependent curcumin reductase CurA
VPASLGFDEVVDQAAGDWAERLARLCPAGIDVFFDKVGGEVLDAALLQMARRGRIVICGATAHYDGTARIANHTMLPVRGCTMAGFFYFDHLDHWPVGRERMADWLRSGTVREVLDIAEGFDAVPEAALGQFTGANIGRKLVRIAEDPFVSG